MKGDIQYELGPQNFYDEIAGRAQILSRKFNDPILLEKSVELAEYIRKYHYNSDAFYKVIVKAKELEKYISFLEKSKNYIFYLKINNDGKEYNPSDIIVRLSENQGIYEFGLIQVRNTGNTKTISYLLDQFDRITKPMKEGLIQEIVYSGDMGASNTHTYFRDKDGNIIIHEIFRRHENESDIGYFNFFHFSEEDKDKYYPIIKEIISGINQNIEPNVKVINLTSQEQANVLTKARENTTQNNEVLKNLKIIFERIDLNNLEEVKRIIRNQLFDLIFNIFEIPKSSATDFYQAKNLLPKYSIDTKEINDLFDRFIKLKSLTDSNKYLMNNSLDKEEVSNFIDFLHSLKIKDSPQFKYRFQVHYNESCSDVIDIIKNYGNTEVLFLDEPPKVFLVKFKTKLSYYWYIIYDLDSRPEDIKKIEEYLLEVFDK